MITCFHLWTARFESKIQPTAFSKCERTFMFCEQHGSKRDSCALLCLNGERPFRFENGAPRTKFRQHMYGSSAITCLCVSITKAVQPRSLLIELHTHVPAWVSTYTYTYVYTMNVYTHTVRCTYVYPHISWISEVYERRFQSFDFASM